MSPRIKLQEFTSECTVHVLQSGVDGKPIEGGSGFFVAPGVIVTCAHVVSSGGRAVSRVKVLWKSEIYEGTAVARPEEKGGGEIWDPPDLCVITLDRIPDGQHSVVLGELGDADRHELYIAGYSRIYDRNNAQFQGKPSGVLGGSQGLAGEMVREIVGVEIARGMSGGPVLDLRRGVVCGVTKAQRRQNDDLGGLFIPAEFIQQKFRSEAWLPNQRASAINSQWRAQRDAVLDEADPAMFRLSQLERDVIVRVVEQLRLTAEDFTRSWGVITELPLRRAIVSLNDLIADLADRTSKELDPITKLFVWLACHDRIGPDSSNELLGYARVRAIRAGIDVLTVIQYEMSVRSRKRTARSPVLVVRLRPDSPAATRTFTVDVWRYPDRGADQCPVVTDAGPYRLLDARKAIIDILKEQVKLVEGRPVIEFALPDSLLDLAVEEWDIGDEVPLGEKYPVVVRLAEREIDDSSYVENLKSHATEFKNGAVPPEGTQQWDDLWLTCQSKYTPRELNRVLQPLLEQGIPMVAMTAWHGRGRALKAIKAVKEAGVAVVVWRHTRCAEAACATSGGGACPGMRFKQETADHFAGEPLAVLPDKIFVARPKQQSNGGLGYQSPGIALIWDDPEMLPWMAGSANLYPDQPAGWDDVEQLADL
ncbi:MAG TPA: trypsin-like peptidase domain-containing protein [Streptosporangiaceae bacterium]|nr:trypsin-like peptidase domain-containing protein [Streptosporangiaceae bacterium]